MGYEGIRSGVRGRGIKTGVRGIRSGVRGRGKGTRLCNMGYEDMRYGVRGIRSGVRGYEIRGTRI